MGALTAAVLMPLSAVPGRVESCHPIEAAWTRVATAGQFILGLVALIALAAAGATCTRGKDRRYFFWIAGSALVLAIPPGVIGAISLASVRGCGLAPQSEWANPAMSRMVVA